jgi:SAM-dependent methyltransferase
MSEAVDYFSNHRLKLRFPWRLYHAPIVSGLAQAVRGAPGPEVLNVGSGPFLELGDLPADGRRFTVCDIDQRAIELARRLHGDKLQRADVIAPGAALPYADGSFDLVVAMEVIEHVPDPMPWLAEVMRVIRPGGALYLTTPNYGSRSLKLLEATALELIARFQGFSRKGLHPTPLDPLLLRQLIARAGGEQIDVRVISFGWVAAASARKPLH